MKVIVTGGSGFIGTALMQWFAKHEPQTEVVLVDIVPPQASMHEACRYVYADIRNLSSLIEPFKGADEVYHLAGILGTSELIPISSLACETNVVGANNVMDAARLTGVKRLYNVAKPHFDGYSENAYTLTKHSGELVGKLYQEKFGMEVATVRWLNAVGPYQHLYPVRKFLPMMILLAMYGLDLEVYGDGTQTIDPIDTRDLARFTVHACRNLGTRKDVVELGSGIAIDCKTAAQVILNRVKTQIPDTKSKIVHMPMREGEKPGVNLVADMSYWDSVGMKNEFSFEDSIDSTIQYMLGLPSAHHMNALKFYGLAK